MKRKERGWDVVKDFYFGRWLVAMNVEYRTKYMVWCMDHRMKPDWEGGFYQWLVMKSVEEEERQEVK